jgi:hypothetical protein
MKRLMLAAALVLPLAAGDAYAGGGGIPAGLPGGPPSSLPGGPPNPGGLPPIPPGSGAGSSSGKSGGMVTGLDERPESKASAGWSQASAALREAFGQVQEGMSQRVSHAVEALRAAVN